MVEMLLGKQDSKIEYDCLSQYIEGWLHYKENKKYERFWFVLRGNIIHGRELCTAYLFCFKDLNIHVEDNVVGQIEIHSHDKVELLKCGGNKPLKCDFTILLSETKFHFRADDEISRERWIYAFCDLIGKSQLPSELPNERNQIRTSLCMSHKKKENDKKGAFHRSQTVELPSARGTFERRRSSPVTHSTTMQSHHSLPRSQTFDCVVETPPVAPPPRTICSLPFMLDPHVELKDLNWFFPGMRREEAQERLSACPIGYYLLRDSESKAGSYTLTFKDTDRVKNHMITQSSDRQYRFHNSEVDTAFPSPHKAVEFYMIKKHSKTLTPIPYCQKAEGSDRDYILPSEMNVPSKPTFSPQPIQAISPTGVPNQSGYRHRELPPTPDPSSFRGLTIEEEDDDEAYLTMATPPSHEPNQRALKTNHEDKVRSYSLKDQSNGYLKVTSSRSYDVTVPMDDQENYLEGVDGNVSGKGSDEDSGSCSDPADQVLPIPVLPEKISPFKRKKIIKFSEYDSVSLQPYENQDVVDGAINQPPPPIPPRSSKPDVPARKGTLYKT